MTIKEAIYYLHRRLNDAFVLKKDSIPENNYIEESSVRRKAGWGSIYIIAIKNLPQGVETQIGTMPDGFVPQIRVQRDTFVVNNTSYSVRFTLYEDGRITAYNYSTNTGVLNLRAFIVYPIDSVGGV